MAVQYLVTWLGLYHMTRIATNGLAVSGYVGPSTIARIYEFS